MDRLLCCILIATAGRVAFEVSRGEEIKEESLQRPPNIEDSFGRLYLCLNAQTLWSTGNQPSVTDWNVVSTPGHAAVSLCAAAEIHIG